MANYRTAAMLLMLTFAAPLAAHKKHHPEPAKVTATVNGVAAPAPAPAPTAAVPAAAPVSVDGEVSPMIRDDDDRSKMTTAARLFDWLGRLHVSIIHFPLAFFPAALFTAAVGRRRPGFATPVQFLVITGGITAPLAALLGWLAGGMILSDSDPLLHIHRWLGTSIGSGGLGLALWAWKRPAAVQSRGMLFALTLISAALLVQGWYGGSMIHGIDHMNW